MSIIRMETKRIIFYLPLKLNPNLHSASHIRPTKMIKGFKDLGYQVDIIDGNGKERKRIIKKIKRDIKKGIKYDFIYSESSTMPTLLTEPNHLPIHPFMDFNFFKFCKKQGIRIGLFYRDIYWKFPDYGIDWRRKIAKWFYKYDLKRYNELLDVLFLPSIEMAKYLPENYNYSIYELPSGAEIEFSLLRKEKNDKIEIFYVGGIGSHYDLTMLVKCVSQLPNFHLTICCRKSDWMVIKDKYEPLMNERISIIHKSGRDLVEYYEKADLFTLFVAPSIYREFAMPYKLFEYIGRGKPVLASRGTKVGQFVANNKCGIVVDYNEAALKEVLSQLNVFELRQLQKNTINFAPSQSWMARAQEVCNILKS